MIALLKKCSMVIILSILCTNVIAAMQSPVQFLQNTTDNVIARLKANDSMLAKNPDYINVLVERELVPKVDFVEMSKWVVGRHVWLKSSENDRSNFVVAFKKLVVRTYASTLNHYSDQKVTYEPLRAQYDGKKRVQVNSTISDPDNGHVRIAYRLVNKNQRWKVYDIIIEGVSLIKGFQAQFADDISQHGLRYTANKINSHTNDDYN